MDEARKSIILKEIKYWKEHRLLPEQYCNFLITLYTEGSEIEQEVVPRKEPFSFRTFLIQLFNLFILLQLILTFVVIYFTEISIDLQIGLFVIFISISLSGAIFFFRKNHSYFHIALIVGVLILFVATVHSVSVITAGLQIGLIVMILLNCLLWVLIGYKLKLKYLTISGFAGAFLLITYTFIL